MMVEIIALDKNTVRTKDADGHLHVSKTPISKTQIVGYLGSEIPDRERFGLDPRKLYRLWRPPEELEKAAPSFNGKPLLIVHKPVSAEDHDKTVTVGSVTNAEWDAPYLMAQLDIWDGEAIDLIESGRQRELSCGYYYELDLTPGAHDGEIYDGVMRNLRANHVAIVEEGRAGPDVLVADAKPKQETRFMPSRAMLSRKASVARGAIATYLRPKLAVDAKIDLPKLLSGVTAANYVARKPKLAEAVKKATTGKLASDASLEDLTEMLDALDDEGMNDPDTYDTDPEDTNPPAPVEDADPMEAVKAFLKDKLTPEDHAKMCAMLDPPAKDEPAAFPGKPEPGKGPTETGKKPAGEAKDSDKPEMMTKSAMDAAIARAAQDAEKRTIARLNAIKEAENTIRPLLGELSLTFDSADQVYAHALDRLGVDHQGVHPSAYPAMTRLAMDAKAAKPVRRPVHDAASSSGIFSRFPEAKRIGF